MPVRTYVSRLTLSHFRNYLSASLTVDERPVMLIGPNGAGKTNILEAISFLTPGRGLRRAPLADLNYFPLPNGEGAWAVAAEVHGPQGATTIGTGRDPQADAGSDKRIVKIDGKTVRGQAAIAKMFSALWLTPQMDNLFLEGGTARRRFLDRLVYSFDPEHASRINAYEFAMRDRNKLLAENRTDAVWLAALEQKMAEQGIAIAVARNLAAEGLSKAVLLSKHSFPQAHLKVTGTVEDMLAEGAALKAEEQFRESLARTRALDTAAGRTLTGVHRAQVGVTHMEKNMPAERCSTGEQKALLVSIILAQTRAGAAWHGTVPVLLLDEVATHLDPIRRGELFREIEEVGAQAWITGTDRETFEGLKAQILNVQNGQIKA